MGDDTLIYVAALTVNLDSSGYRPVTISYNDLNTAFTTFRLDSYNSGIFLSFRN